MICYARTLAEDPNLWASVIDAQLLAGEWACNKANVILVILSMSGSEKREDKNLRLLQVQGSVPPACKAIGDDVLEGKSVCFLSSDHSHYNWDVIHVERPDGTRLTQSLIGVRLLIRMFQDDRSTILVGSRSNHRFRCDVRFRDR